MRMSSFQIKNFKSIIDTGECKLSEIDNIVVLAGQNEAGKTAVLEALDFFRNGPAENFSKYQRRLGSEVTSVICTFKIEKGDLTAENTGFPEKLIEQIYMGVPYVRFNREDIKGQGDQGFNYFEEFENKLTNIVNSFLATVVEGKKNSIENSAQKSEETKVIEIEPVNPENMVTIVIEVLLKAIPNFSLYITFKDLLPSEMPLTDLSKSNAVNDFEKVFSVKLSEYAQISDTRERKSKIESLEKRATEDLNKSWSQTIASMNNEKEYSYSIEINHAPPVRISFMVKGKDGIPLYLEQKSAGFKWFSAFHLRLRSLMEDFSHQNEDSYNGIRFVLLIDEPGQNLHEVAQKDVKKILEETAGKNIQIIYSTHNPNLIGIEGKEFTRIKLVSNNEEIGTKVENVTQFISRGDAGRLEALSPIRTAMGIINVQSIFDANKYNVVVEGITDHYYLSAFQKYLNKDKRIHFIPACGVDNICNLVSVLIGWGCKFISVFDDDPTQGRKAYNKMRSLFFEDNDEIAHKYIYKLKDCIGVEDIFTQQDFENIILGRTRTPKEKHKINSDLVKISGKEMYARLFLEKIDRGDNITFQKETLKKINDIFEWITKNLSISQNK